MTDSGKKYSPESGRRADPDVAIRTIRNALEAEDVNPDRAAHKSLDWDNEDHRALVRSRFDGSLVEDEPMLPGFGPDGFAETARDDCGDDHPFVCDSCGNSVPFGRTCSMSVCGRCGVAWVRDTAISHAAKVRRVRKTKHQRTPANEHQKLHHQVISPSLGWWFDLADAGLSLEEAYELTDDVVEDILDEQRGPGVVVRHSYRGSRDDGSIRSEADDRGMWKELLNSGRDWHGDVREQLAWMPHYHCIVVSDFIKGDGFADVLEDATGWVVHRITDDQNVSLANDGAMARALTYCLSHGDIVTREDANNRSANWQTGYVEDEHLQNSSELTAHPADLDWADAVVREHASKTLGLASSTTECGAELPAVDDPDALAADILRDLYPDHDGDVGADVADAVLHHISEGNLSITHSAGEFELAEGSAGDLPSSPSAFGGEGGAFSLPGASSEASAEAEECGCGECDDHDRADDLLVDDVDDVQEDSDDECDGTLVPLGVARQRGLLDDDEWLAEAPFAEEAIEVDREWPDDLDPWRASSPGITIGAD